MTPYEPPQNPYTNLMYWWGQNNLAGKVLTDKAREEAERLRKQERSEVRRNLGRKAFSRKPRRNSLQKNNPAVARSTASC